jgi:hypothetical protein
MPDIRLQALPQATNLDQALAVGGESIYDLLDRIVTSCPGKEEDEECCHHSARPFKRSRQKQRASYEDRDQRSPPSGTGECLQRHRDPRRHNETSNQTQEDPRKNHGSGVWMRFASGACHAA